MSITTPKRELIIVGAGGFGRELFTWASDQLKQSPTHQLIGFIDENTDALNGFNYPIPILEKISSFIPTKNQDLLIAIGNPKTRHLLVTSLKAKGATFFTLIHPSVRINANTTIGEGSVICPNAILSNDSSIGNFVTINSFTTIGHDVTIGDFCSINGHCDITGNCTLGESVFMGSRSGTIPGVKLGHNCIVAAGSTAMRHVKASTTVIGTPAKKFL